jgi:hypothetical protein
VMVPEHFPAMPYTHVTSGRIWHLGSATFVSQSSACGGWLGVFHCHVLSLVQEVVIRSTCLFHSSQLPVPLILFCGSIGCMSNEPRP